MKIKRQQNNRDRKDNDAAVRTKVQHKNRVL